MMLIRLTMISIFCAALTGSFAIAGAHGSAYCPVGVRPPAIVPLSSGCEPSVLFPPRPPLVAPVIIGPPPSPVSPCGHAHCAPPPYRPPACPPPPVKCKPMPKHAPH